MVCNPFINLCCSGWKQWNIAYKQINVTDSNSEDVTECVTEDTTDPETISYLKKNQGTYVCVYEHTYTYVHISMHAYI